MVLVDLTRDDALSFVLQVDDVAIRTTEYHWTHADLCQVGSIPEGWPLYFMRGDRFVFRLYPGDTLDVTRPAGSMGGSIRVVSQLPG